MQRVGWLQENRARPGNYSLIAAVRSRLYTELLDTHPLPKLREVLHKHCGFNSERMYGYWPLYDQGATVAILRLELFSGANSETLTRWQRGIAHLLMTEWAKSVLAQVIPNPSTTAMLVQRAAFDQCAEVLLERIAAGAG